MKFDENERGERPDSARQTGVPATPVGIVTGGTHGIGRQSVLALGRAGWRVVFQGRDQVAGEALAAHGSSFVYVPGDITRPETIERLIGSAADLDSGRISGLVNNAGRSMRKPFADCSLADWDEILALNSRSVFAVTQAALPGLRRARGAVVFVSSVAGQFGEDGLSVYSASKAALIALAKSLAIELGQEVRFNAVCPGQIATRMMERVSRSPELLQAVAERIPQRRMGGPEEVAAAIAWLLSPAASFVNGTTLVLDGGETSGLAALMPRPMQTPAGPTDL